MPISLCWGFLKIEVDDDLMKEVRLGDGNIASLARLNGFSSLVFFFFWSCSLIISDGLIFVLKRKLLGIAPENQEGYLL